MPPALGRQARSESWAGCCLQVGSFKCRFWPPPTFLLKLPKTGRWRMATRTRRWRTMGRTFRTIMMSTQRSLGNRESMIGSPVFPFWGGFPDSRFPRFPIGRESWSRGHHAGDFLVWLRVSLAVVHQSSTAVCLPVTVQYGASRRSTRVQPSRFSALATQHSEPYYSTIQARVLCTV